MKKKQPTKAAQFFLKIQKEFQKDLEKFIKSRENLNKAFDEMTLEDKVSLWVN